MEYNDFTYKSKIHNVNTWLAEIFFTWQLTLPDNWVSAESVRPQCLAQ